MKLSKVWIIQMWWSSSKFSKMRQSTLALAVYHLKSCNVVDGRKIFALSWSYSKAWFIDPVVFLFLFNIFWPMGSSISLHLGFWIWCISSTLRRKLVGANRAIQECLGRNAVVADRLLSKRLVSPWGPRGMPWEEKSPRCDKQEQGQSCELHKNLRLFHDASCIWRSQLRKPSALRDQDELSHCQNLRPDSRVLLRVF